MSPIKRKAHFRCLSTESLKRFRLDPSPEPGDSTIAVYHERTQAEMPEDRDRLDNESPFGAELAKIQDLELGLEKLEAEFEEMRVSFARDRLQIQEMRDSRLSTLVANASIDLAKTRRKDVEARVQRRPIYDTAPTTCCQYH